MRAKIHFDGACNNNDSRGKKKEKPTGIGVAVFIDGEYAPDFSVGEPGPLGTSNIAEWHGCVRAMEIALEMKQFADKIQEPIDIRVFSDSEVVTNQFNGIFQIKEVLFLNYFRQATDFARRAGMETRISWIPRERNEAADLLSKKGLNKAKIDFQGQLTVTGSMR